MEVPALERVFCKGSYCMPNRGRRCGEVELKWSPQWSYGGRGGGGEARENMERVTREERAPGSGSSEEGQVLICLWAKTLRFTHGKIGNPFTMITSYVVKCCNLSSQKT